jgi:hypothetical protein
MVIGTWKTPLIMFTARLQLSRHQSKIFLALHSPCVKASPHFIQLAFQILMGRGPITSCPLSTKVLYVYVCLSLFRS